MTFRSEMYNPILHPLLFTFQLIQWLLDKILSPNPPTPKTHSTVPESPSSALASQASRAPRIALAMAST